MEPDDLHIAVGHPIALFTPRPSFYRATTPNSVTNICMAPPFDSIITTTERNQSSFPRSPFNPLMSSDTHFSPMPITYFNSFCFDPKSHGLNFINPFVPGAQPLGFLPHCLPTRAQPLASLAPPSVGTRAPHGVVSLGCNSALYAWNNSRRMYKCNICRMEFPSYQALGGHKSSHTKQYFKQFEPGESSRASKKSKSSTKN